jgi:hypothetical protein
MRTRVAVLVAVACLWVSSAFGQSRPVAVFSYRDTSCGTWVASTGDIAGRAQYHSWFRGFVSGYNFGNPGNQVPLTRMPDEQTLYLFVDKYCRDNPLNPFVSSAFKLVEELREFPGTRGTSEP